jgi:hypothetical protein
MKKFKLLSVFFVSTFLVSSGLHAARSGSKNMDPELVEFQKAIKDSLPRHLRNLADDIWEDYLQIVLKNVQLDRYTFLERIKDLMKHDIKTKDFGAFTRLKKACKRLIKRDVARHEVPVSQNIVPQNTSVHTSVHPMSPLVGVNEAVLNHDQSVPSNSNSEILPQNNPINNNNFLAVPERIGVNDPVLNQMRNILGHSNSEIAQYKAEQHLDTTQHQDVNNQNLSEQHPFDAIQHQDVNHQRFDFDFSHAPFTGDDANDLWAMCEESYYFDQINSQNQKDTNNTHISLNNSADFKMLVQDIFSVSTNTVVLHNNEDEGVNNNHIDEEMGEISDDLEGDFRFKDNKGVEVNYENKKSLTENQKSILRNIEKCVFGRSTQ